ncbi:hypothetical protein IHE44_0000133 [Lamprotornis superbus]|uniref:Uncharacterized protein n=1 Tax=Lamprotornis superbus TaxID=245042 RepID=A0A835P4U6_9PASS|nr:hypothetical protein IHE44_0000133 [Lamprotornis superbus]
MKSANGCGTCTLASDLNRLYLTGYSSQSLQFLAETTQVFSGFLPGQCGPNMKAGELGKEGRKDSRKEGRIPERKEGRIPGRIPGRKDSRKEGRKDSRKEGLQEGRKITFSLAEFQNHHSVTQLFTLLPSREQHNGWKSHQGRAAALGDDIVYMNGNMKPQPEIDGMRSALEITLPPLITEKALMSTSGKFHTGLEIKEVAEVYHEKERRKIKEITKEIDIVELDRKKCLVFTCDQKRMRREKAKHGPGVGLLVTENPNVNHAKTGSLCQGHPALLQHAVTYFVIRSMLAICFWFRIISIAAQRCWIAFVSACRLFVRRAMTCLPVQNYPSLKLPQPPALPEALKTGEWYLTASYGVSTNSDTEKKLDPQLTREEKPMLKAERGRVKEHCNHEFLKPVAAEKQKPYGIIVPFGMCFQNKLTSPQLHPYRPQHSLSATRQQRHSSGKADTVKTTRLPVISTHLAGPNAAQLSAATKSVNKTLSSNASLEKRSAQLPEKKQIAFSSPPKRFMSGQGQSLPREQFTDIEFFPRLLEDQLQAEDLESVRQDIKRDYESFFYIEEQGFFVSVKKTEAPVETECVHASDDMLKENLRDTEPTNCKLQNRLHSGTSTPKYQKNEESIGQKVAFLDQCESGDVCEMPPTSTQEHKDKQKSPCSLVPGEEEAPQEMTMHGQLLTASFNSTADKFVSEGLSCRVETFTVNEKIATQHWYENCYKISCLLVKIIKEAISLEENDATSHDIHSQVISSFSISKQSDCKSALLPDVGFLRQRLTSSSPPALAAQLISLIQWNSEETEITEKHMGNPLKTIGAKCITAKEITISLWKRYLPIAYQEEIYLISDLKTTINRITPTIQRPCQMIPASVKFTKDQKQIVPKSAGFRISPKDTKFPKSLTLAFYGGLLSGTHGRSGKRTEAPHHPYRGHSHTYTSILSPKKKETGL